MTHDADLDRPQSLRLVRVRVPLVTAHAAAHGTEEVREVVLVGWSAADGAQGWGECPTLSGAGYATETTERAWSALRDHLAPAALDPSGRRDPAVPDDVVAARAALADAALDASLRRAGVALRDHLGAATASVPRCRVLARLGDPPERLAEAARQAVAEGAAMVKVKVAPGHDLAPLTAVVDALGADRVAADANGAYSDPSELEPVDALGLRYLEQPFPAHLPLDELAGMAGRLATPVALDESLTSLDAVRSALDCGAAAVVSVKPARLGGLLAAAEAVNTAARAGADAFVGGMLELGVGRAGAAAVAALVGCTLPTDLGPSEQYVREDVCAPIVTDASGRLVLPSGVGIGRAPDEEVLSRCTVDEVVLSRRSRGAP